MDDITWLPDGEHWLQVKEGKLWKIEARTGRAVSQFVDPKKLMLSLTNLPEIDYKKLPKELAVPRYTFDPTFKAILIHHDKSHYIAFRDGKNGCKLGECEIPTFSPDGELLAFVRGGNLWVAEVANGNPMQLTYDGGKNDILNGKADWIYEEEIFHRKGQAYWWSPDSKQIAFLRFDDSEVPKFALTHNGELHSTVENISYPKPGDKNPTVQLGVVDVTEIQPKVKLLWPPEGAIARQKAGIDQVIISRVGWVPGKEPVPFAYIQDRKQSFLTMLKFTKAVRPEYYLHKTSQMWIDDPGEPHWLKDGSFLILLEHEGHKQICLFDKNGKFQHHVTAGDYDVKAITKIGGDVLAYFVCRTDGSTIDRHRFAGISRVNTPGKIPYSNEQSTKVTYSPNGEYALRQYLSDKGPSATWLHGEDPLRHVSRLLDSNPTYEREKYRFGKYERTKITTRDGFEMEAAITYPPDFHELNKYPIWMLTYGGPNAPTIKDGWAGGRVFEQILAAQGIVVVRVDPQSASGKGMVNTKVCYKQLGVKELQDLEDAVDWLAKKPWADTKRVGLSGHSFGGFLTAFALTHSKKFSAGIAGAPVTDWRLYDSIYTERYMGLPSENKEGYDKTSVIKAAKDLHGELLIVHGLVDDNVHAQNSLQLIAAMQKAGKDFEVMVYPDDRHGIAGLHYPQTMLKFIVRTMGVKR